MSEAHPEPENVRVAPARMRRSGVTLLESLIVVAVLGIVLSTVVPGLRGFIDRRHLEGLAAQLETDIQFARGLAVAQEQPSRISFASDASGSGWVIHQGPPAHCKPLPDGASVCSGTARVLKSVHLAPGAGAPVHLHANVNTMVFDAQKGTVTPTGTVRFVGRAGTIHQVVNLMGRIRTCSPASATGLRGYPAC